MNFLITGGLGHIGSFFLNKIPAKHGVRVVDNLSSSRWNSIFTLNRKIDFREKDIKEVDSSDLKNIDVVIHLAAITNAVDSFANRSQVEIVNVQNTVELINRCKSFGIKLFIFPSSTSVYGVSAEKVYEDDSSYINPQSPYATSKIAVEEEIVSNLGEGTKYLILRLGTIFGVSPGMRFHTAINKFCYQASSGKPLTIWKENYRTHRPYLGLEDCFFAVTHLVQRPKYWNQIYNVITDNFKTKTIIDIISKYINIEKKMVDCPMLNQHTYKVSDQKIRDAGFTPMDNVELAIEKTIDLLRYIV
jgi:UDP-glucose 4-epimerase